ncbi:ATP-dependent Clp protease ATP-binding subunit ClpX [Candidatus Karelsulcia muelleri]
MLKITIKTSLICSFCHANKKDLIQVLRIDNEWVCKNCLINILYIYKIYINFKHDQNENKLFVTPNKIKDYLDQYIIGQEEAKQIVSVSIYNHYKRLLLYEKNIEVNKGNILLIGNTGTGKTMLAKSMARLLKIPLAIVDATSFTEAGYVGDDVESILTKLLQQAHFDLKLAEQGIIFIDEIDKIAKTSIQNTSRTRDVSGEGVQQALLKILEGSHVNISTQCGRKHPDQPMVSINTQKILFISGGTFAGLDEIVYNRLNVSPIGFHNKRKDKNKEYLNDLQSEDLITFGFIPEFIGRWPIICPLHNLTEKEYKEILLSSNNSILKQYKNSFKWDHIYVSMTKQAIELIIKQAIKLNLGARGLHAICYKLFHKYTFYLEAFQKKHIQITQQVIKELIETI